MSKTCPGHSQLSLEVGSFHFSKKNPLVKCGFLSHTRNWWKVMETFNKELIICKVHSF